MRKQELAYDRDGFWRGYWQKHSVDREEFVDLDIYPIELTLKYSHKSDCILECGFGAGRVIRHLAKNGYRVEGVEYDAGIVEQVHRVAPTLNIRQGNICSLPWPDGSFDVVLCFGVCGGLEAQLGAALMELKRVARPGGILLVSVMLDNLGRRAQRLINRLQSGERRFYSWMDSPDGWQNYFQSLDLHTLERKEVVSRYNVFYWAPLLRSKEPSDLTLARVKDDEYKLSTLGKWAWFLHRILFRTAFSGGMTFALRNGYGKHPGGNRAVVFPVT